MGPNRNGLAIGPKLERCIDKIVLQKILLKHSPKKRLFRCRRQKEGPTRQKRARVVVSPLAASRTCPCKRGIAPPQTELTKKVVIEVNIDIHPFLLFQTTFLVRTHSPQGYCHGARPTGGLVADIPCYSSFPKGFCLARAFFFAPIFVRLYFLSLN
jgi:hypothetical protein